MRILHAKSSPGCAGSLCDSAGGRFLVETRSACVLKVDGDSYLVNIDGDKVWRFLESAAQADPGAFVAQLNAGFDRVQS